MHTFLCVVLSLLQGACLDNTWLVVSCDGLLLYMYFIGVLFSRPSIKGSTKPNFCGDKGAFFDMTTLEVRLCSDVNAQ